MLGTNEQIINSANRVRCTFVFVAILSLILSLPALGGSGNRVPMPVTGFLTATELDNEINGYPVRIQYQGGGNLFGCSVNDLSIWKTVDGSTWVSAGPRPPASVNKMWAADLSGNCIMASFDNPPAIFYGTYSSGSLIFTRAKKDGSDFSISSSAVEDWSLFRLASGALLLSEYGTNGRYIYRSTDLGHTWTQVYDAGSGIITHWHAFGQLLRTGRIIASSGDSAKAKTIYSDDDGITWQDLYIIGTKLIQPVAYLDVSDATKLLCADDTYEDLFLLDVYSGDITRIFTLQDRRSNANCWSLTRNGDTIYVSTFDNMAELYIGNRSPATIYATNDLVNWPAIYRVSAPMAMGTRRLTWFNNALHGIISCSSGAAITLHLTLIPPPVTHRISIAVESDVTNLLATPGRSSFECEAPDSWEHYVSGPSPALVDINTPGVNIIPDGNHAVKFTSSSNFTAYVSANDGTKGVPVSGGQRYSGSVIVGVPTDGVSVRVLANWNKFDGLDSVWAAQLRGYYAFANIKPGEWTTIDLKPDLAYTFDGVLGIYLTVSTDVPCTKSILVDKVQIGAAGQQPSNWQIGGTSRAKSAYNINWNTSDKCTHTFTFCPVARSSWYDRLGGNWYIRSWSVSSSVYAQLYYSADDQKFKLFITDGTNSETLSTNALAFNKGQPLIFVIQFGTDLDAKVHMHVGHGRAIETVTPSTNNFTGFGLSNVLVRWGDKDSENGFNGTLYDFEMTGTVPSDIVTHVAGLILGGPNAMSFQDYAHFGNNWLNTGCSISNDCDHADIDHSGTVDYRDLSILATNWLNE